MLNAVKISAAVRKKREKILTRIKINKFYLGGDQGAKYLGFFSSRSLKTKEKCISFAQLVLLSLYIFSKKNIIVNFIIQKLKSEPTSLKKYTN